MSDGFLSSDAATARKLQQLLASFSSGGGGGVSGTAMPGRFGGQQPVYVELLQWMEADETDPADARLLRLDDDGGWESTDTLIPVRNLTETPLDRELRFLAWPVPRLGHCILMEQRLIVRIEETLFAADHWLNAPQSAQARIVRRRSDGTYGLSTKTITVWNRFENITLPPFTQCRAERLGNEWQLYAADCPTPSSSSSSSSGGGGGGISSGSAGV